MAGRQRQCAFARARRGGALWSGVQAIEAYVLQARVCVSGLRVARRSHHGGAVTDLEAALAVYSERVAQK